MQSGRWIGVCGSKGSGPGGLVGGNGVTVDSYSRHRPSRPILSLLLDAGVECGRHLHTLALDTVKLGVRPFEFSTLPAPKVGTTSTPRHVQLTGLIILVSSLLRSVRRGVLDW